MQNISTVWKDRVTMATSKIAAVHPIGNPSQRMTLITTEKEAKTVPQRIMQAGGAKVVVSAEI